MRKRFDIRLRNGRSLTLGERTVVVGVLNVTPDSFSDGGEHFDTARAVDRALQMEADGADIIEVGGESTRPGALPVPAAEEIARIGPVLRALAGRLRVPVAVDTYKSEVARAAIELGAGILNDVSALRFDPALADVAAREGAPLVLMHMRGDPATMQAIEPSRDIFSEIESDLRKALSEAASRGVDRDRIIIDPGVGFGKTLEQNLAILNNLDRLAGLDMPIMVGTSRKSFIGRLTGRPPQERIFGTAASVAVAIARGAHIVRVHDVGEMVEVARITDAIIGAQ
ncbi:MAG TPA: dihydropteroate synthase [Blastocatellia bacterium]|nr:dihydropteroate synthase [Blastocatellia bacterium]